MCFSFYRVDLINMGVTDAISDGITVPDVNELTNDGITVTDENEQINDGLTDPGENGKSTNGITDPDVLDENGKTTSVITDPDVPDAGVVMHNGSTVPDASDVVTSGITVPDVLDVRDGTDDGITIPNITDVIDGTSITDMTLDGITTPDVSNKTTNRHSDVTGKNSLPVVVSVSGDAACCFAVNQKEDTLVETEEEHCTDTPANDAEQSNDDFITHREDKDLVTRSGIPTMVLNEIDNIRFPMSPPVRGRCKVKKGKPVRENSFKSRLRLLQRKG